MDSVTSQAEIDLLAAIQRPSLRPLEIEIEDSAETLWRQVHPNNINSGVLNNAAFVEAVVADTAFVGTKAAKYEVSTSMGSVVTAQDAHEHFILALVSAGSYMVTVADVISSNSRAIDDSATYILEGDVVGHAIIDLRGMPRILQRRARSHLAHVATQHGRQFPPHGETRLGPQRP